jgi:succinate-semialdehyde dehydrogenase/glutarate-semialdehyde dehydrogenase
MIKLTDASLWQERGFIDGGWVDADSGQTTGIRNPASGEPLGSVPDMGAAETRRAIEAAHRALPAWSRKTAGERARLMRAWFDLMMANQQDLAIIMTAEQGKPLAESRGEIAYAAAFIEWFAEEAKRVYGEVIPGHQADKRILVLRQPIGVVAAITPWNFPAAMITRKAAPAIAAGCPIVVKPAPQTPFSALAMAELARRAGIPAGVFNVVTGDAVAIGGEFTGNARVRKLSFTGSTPVGKLLMAHGQEGGAGARRQCAVPGARGRRPGRGGRRRHRQQVPQHRPDLRVRQPFHRAFEGLRRLRRETHRGRAQAARGGWAQG